MKFSLRNWPIFILACMCVSTPTANADFIVWTEGLSGTVPGSSISYTITSNHDSTVPVSDSSTWDNDHTWDPAGTNYIKSGHDIVSTITFSSPIPINALSTLAVDFNTPGSTDTILVAGGTATTMDLALDPGLFNPSASTEMAYNAASGVLSHTGATLNNGRHDAHLLGISSATLTMLRHTASGLSSGDGTVINFGFMRGVAVPEPSSLRLTAFSLCAVLATVALRRIRAKGMVRSVHN